MEEDARQAMKEIKNYDGKTISVSVAKKKIHDKRRTGRPVGACVSLICNGTGYSGVSAMWFGFINPPFFLSS